MDAEELKEFAHDPQAERFNKLRDWIAIYSAIAGSCLMAIGIILDDLWIGIAGAIVFVVAGLGAVANGIMAHTEPRAEGERAYHGSDTPMREDQEDRFAAS